MIDISLVKEQYSLMSDENLISFAKNESDNLTIESFHVLKEEFEKRSLDISVIENAQIDRDLNNLNKQTKFEQVATNQFIESIWQKAFEDKRKGKTNYEIFNSLVKKGIEGKSAYMLVESLESRSLELLKHYQTEINVEWFFIFVGVIGVLLSSQNIMASIYILYTAMIIGGAVYKLIRSYSKKNKYQEIYDIIQIENESNNVGISDTISEN